MSSQKFNLEKVLEVVSDARTEQAFNSIAKTNLSQAAVNFVTEANFAKQILRKSDYITSVAANNQQSLYEAIVNVAAVGLTLNPVHGLAYLVPRKKEICLDISYMGYCKLATDCGALAWVGAEIVRENDTFILHGIGTRPTHKFKPGPGRGKITGTYCLAKTHDGEYLTTYMDLDEVYKIRDKYSESWIAHVKERKPSPWASNEEEQIKKTAVRRARKMWPKTDSRRLEKATELLVSADQVKEEDLSASVPSAPSAISKRAEALESIVDTLKKLNRSEEAFLGHCNRIYKRDVKKLEDLTNRELTQQIIALSQMLEVQTKKAQIAQKETTNENAS
ncbi:MAG: recombinase RecT [Bdellovibrio sp.]|nr:recombinase RecT [Bdellovibrio sp.]